MIADRKRRMIFVCMHPLNNVPPPLNAAVHYGEKGNQVIILCYHDQGLPRIVRLATGAWMLRISLSSRKIPISLVRYLFSILEFLWKAIVVVRRLKPEIIITFNEIAAILHKIYLNRFCKESRRVAWLLEFPENLERSIGKSILFKLSVRAWRYADLIIAPTQERLAMACVLQQELINRNLLVVHNAPLNRDVNNSVKYSSGYYEVEKFVQADHIKNTIKIIYAGAIGNRYGLDSLIMAVGNSSQPVSLLVLGKKHELSSTEFNAALAVVRNKDQIRWVDSIDYSEMNNLLTWFDVGYVTYVGDTLNTYFAAPGKLYEYLKASLVILTDEGITLHNELLSHQCGVFFSKPVTREGIEEQINFLAAELTRIPVMKSNARKLFLETYSFDKQIRKVDLYLSGE
jgi:hypothetical protein